MALILPFLPKNHTKPPYLCAYVCGEHTYSMCLTSRMHFTVAAAAADGVCGLCYRVNRCKMHFNCGGCHSATVLHSLKKVSQLRLMEHHQTTSVLLHLGVGWRLVDDIATVHVWVIFPELHSVHKRGHKDVIHSTITFNLWKCSFSKAMQQEALRPIVHTV